MFRLMRLLFLLLVAYAAGFGPYHFNQMQLCEDAGGRMRNSLCYAR